MSSIAEYNLVLSYNDIENILLEKEQELNIKYKFKFSGSSASLTASELSCLLFSGNENFWWVLNKETDILLLNNYSLEIKDQWGKFIFREKAGVHNGKPAILVGYCLDSTMNSIARDLLRDIIPSKGSLSPKQRLWN